MRRWSDSLKANLCQAQQRDLKTIAPLSHRPIVLTDTIDYRTIGFLHYRPNHRYNSWYSAYTKVETQHWNVALKRKLTQWQFQAGKLAFKHYDTITMYNISWKAILNINITTDNELRREFWLQWSSSKLNCNCDRECKRGLTINDSKKTVTINVNKTTSYNTKHRS